MRKSVATMIAATAAVSGCGQIHAEDGGAAVARNYQVGNFQQIEVAGPYDVDVKTGANAAVSARGSEKLLERTVVEVKGDKLVIRPEHQGRFHMGWSSHGKARFTVTVPQLSGATIAGSGDIHIDRVAGNNFEGVVAGSGGIDVGALDVQTLKLAIAGSGAAKAGVGKAQRAEYEIAGSGDLDARAVQTQSVMSRSPVRAASAPMPPAPPRSASWDRATSMSPAAPSARSARPARAACAALKPVLSMSRKVGACAPSFSPRPPSPAAAPAASRDPQLRHRQLHQGPGRRSVQGHARDRRRAVRAGERLAGRTRPPGHRCSGRHARRPHQRLVLGRLSGHRHRAGRDQPRHPRPQRCMAQRRRRNCDRPRQRA